MLLLKIFIKIGFLLKLASSLRSSSNLSLKLAIIYFSVFVKPHRFIKGEGKSLMEVYSLEIVSFLVHSDCVLMEGEIVRNKEFIGLVELF